MSTASSSASSSEFPISEYQRLIESIEHLTSIRYKDRALDAERMFETGKMLCVLKEATPHGEFLKIVSSRIGIKPHTAARMMNAAKKFESRAVQSVLSAVGGKTKLLEMLILDEEQIEELVRTGEIGELRLEDIARMKVKEVRAAIRDEVARWRKSDHLNIQPVTSDRSPPTDLNPGDRIRSRYAGRTGAVVKVYGDGSACVCWDDGEPQPEGLGHERMPRHLLEIVDRLQPAAASAIDAAAGREARAGAELDRFQLQDGASAQAVPKTAREPVGPRPGGGAEASIEKRRAYCGALLKTLLRYADEADLAELEQALEDQVTEITGSRHCPGLVAARYDVFRKFWLNGEVHHG